jgi:hypothetical protein
MKENWYALLAAILNPDYNYAGTALRALGVKTMKPKNPLLEVRYGIKTEGSATESRA